MGPSGRRKPRRLKQEFDPRLLSHYNKISDDHYDDHAALQRKANYVFDVMDFGATGDGATDDTQAFADAVTEAAVGGGVVVVPPGSFLVDRVEIPGYRVSIRGAGSPLSVLLHRRPEGPVVDFDGWGESSGFLSTGQFAGFSIVGVGRDASEVGLNVASRFGAIGSIRFDDIAVRHTGGAACFAAELYLSVFRDCIFGRPDGIDRGNDVPYVELRACNGTRMFNCGFRSTTTNGDAPAGMLRLSNASSLIGHDLVFRDCWTEFVHPVDAGIVVENRMCTFAGWSFFDQAPSSPETAWVEIAGSGNWWDSVIPGTYGSWATGIRVSGSRNRIDGTKGYTGAGNGSNVVLTEGASYNVIIGAGQDSGVPWNSAPMVEDRSGNATNVLLDMTNGAAALRTLEGR